jgi:3-hydroxyacyl-CoA dehydrogenase/enoyl-CoA hydratase/3-hydroxybutyryl-CoA epimerase
VLTDDKHAAIGLPESLVGLLPGAGGTQRLPRLIGIKNAMPILLQGRRLGGEGALEAGVAHRVVKSGEEIMAAEAWLLSSPEPLQPWDRDDWRARPPSDVSAALAPIRQTALETSLGHYPAIFAILDCVEFGLPQSFEGGIRSEMTSFSHLVLRPEPRAMIQTMFLGRVDYEKLERKKTLPDLVRATIGIVQSEVARAQAQANSLAAAGFGGLGRAEPRRERQLPGYWVESGHLDADQALQVLQRIHDAVSTLGPKHSEEELRIADYAAVTQAGYPAYLGGPFSFRSQKWA